MQILVKAAEALSMTSCSVRLVFVPLLLATIMTSACVTSSPENQSWGGDAHWPRAVDFKRAAVTAARDPQTWVPLASAALLSIGDADESASAWLARETPVFGSNAADASDTLVDVLMASYAISALVAPSDSFSDKATGLVIGAGTLSLNTSLTSVLKSAVGRERPNARDNKSFPSGHSSAASAGATMVARNIDQIAMPGWLNTGLTAGVYGLAGSTALARVEAGEHYLTDVLVGYSLGHFTASFMQELFFGSALENHSFKFVPLKGGGVLELRFAISNFAQD